MAVNWIPVAVTVLAAGLFIGALYGIQGKKRALTCGVLASCFMLPAIGVYGRGYLLLKRASQGDAIAQFERAKWEECHCERINRFVLWPCSVNVDGGYRWLEKAAEAGNSEAQFALGARLKYGQFVPGNSDPSRGQELIDMAIKAGFVTSVPEEQFYWRVFRR